MAKGSKGMLESVLKGSLGGWTGRFCKYIIANAGADDKAEWIQNNIF